MLTVPVLSLHELLASLPGETGAGPDLRATPSTSRAFQALKHNRMVARSAERQIATGEEVNGARPNWQPVLELGCQILSETSKDLEVAAYVVEGLVRLHGFAGLRDGFRLCRGLVEGYWEGLHPRPDEDGWTSRVAPLMALNGEGADGTLIVPILNIPLTDPASSPPFGCSHYQQAESTERITDAEARKRRVERGAISLKNFQAAVADSPAAFFARLAVEIDESIAEFRDLAAALDELCGDQSPHTSNIRNALEACRDAVHNFAGEKIRLAAAMSRDHFPPPAPASLGLNEGESDPGPFAEAGRPQVAFHAPRASIPSREHALLLMKELADFFHRTEPHSPLSYALEQAIRWGRTPLPQLLDELIPDLMIKQHYFRLVGIPQPVHDD